MCGAFSIRINPWQLKFIVDVEPFRAWKPIYNARPGEWLPIITEEQPKAITNALWNYVPHWMKDGKGKGVINAKSETVAEKPYFRSSFQRQRCVIPADGFYEWLRKDKFKVPYFFHRPDNKPFLFAGLYDRMPGSKEDIGFAILTTEPNGLVGKVHNRMPVILEDGQESIWLDDGANPVELKSLLDPYPESDMAAYPVSRKVNYAREKGPEVLEPSKVS